MIKYAAILPFATLALTGCGEEKEAPPAVEAPLGAYKAGGTEPGWSVDISENTMEVTANYGEDKFSIPINSSRKTADGWIVKGFDDKHNMNLTIMTGKECNDGMSDRVYADTVTATAGGIGTLEGCGGDITEGADTAP